jgi:hypothetical protein
MTTKYYGESRSYFDLAVDRVGDVERYHRGASRESSTSEQDGRQPRARAGGTEQRSGQGQLVPGKSASAEAPYDGRLMNDDEILGKWRERYPYINLGQAKALQRLDRKFGHLGAAQEVRERDAAMENDRRLRQRLFGVPPTPSSSQDAREEP